MSELGTYEAAGQYHVAPTTLLNLIAQGRLKAVKNEYNRWRISRESLEEWNSKRIARRMAHCARLNTEAASD
jgi:excisionase family DNA binding protein